MTNDELMANLDQLQKFCERKSVSRWKEDEAMWTRYADTIKQCKQIINSIDKLNKKG